MQLFLRLVMSSLLVGLVTGLSASAVQRFQVVPIIQAAEVFEPPESAEPAAPHDHQAGMAAHEHHHDEAAWQPSDGIERTFWTAIANVLVSVGFALLLLPCMAWWDTTRGGHSASLTTGLLWGAAGWACLFVWPSLGLPPELPGEAAAPLQARQAWWTLAALCAAAGLATLVFARSAWRVLGAVALAVPFIVGAPRVPGPAFPAATAEAAAQLAALKSQFIVATAIASALQWLVLGAFAAWAAARWLRPCLASRGSRSAMPRAAA